MTKLDPYEPIFSHQDVSDCACIKKTTLQSYLVGEHLKPRSIDGRGAFTAAQMVEIYLIHQLAYVFKMPPSVGSEIAKQLVSEMPAGMLTKDAADAETASNWSLSASYRGHVRKGRDIDLVVPVQRFAREILGRAVANLWIGMPC